MNYVIAQGSEGSLIRRFQDRPQLGVNLLDACEAALSFMSGGECTPKVERELREKLRQAINNVGMRN